MTQRCHSKHLRARPKREERDDCLLGRRKPRGLELKVPREVYASNRRQTLFLYFFWLFGWRCFTHFGKFQLVGKYWIHETMFSTSVHNSTENRTCECNVYRLQKNTSEFTSRLICLFRREETTLSPFVDCNIPLFPFVYDLIRIYSTQITRANYLLQQNNIFGRTFSTFVGPLNQQHRNVAVL